MKTLTRDRRYRTARVLTLPSAPLQLRQRHSLGVTGSATGTALGSFTFKRKVFEEIGSGFPDFYQMYEYSTEKKYNFLFCNIEHQKVYHNFTELLYDKDTAMPD